MGVNFQAWLKPSRKSARAPRLLPEAATARPIFIIIRAPRVAVIAEAVHQETDALAQGRDRYACDGGAHQPSPVEEHRVQGDGVWTSLPCA